MEKQVVTREQVIKDLVELFGINENTKSRINEENGSFFIDKREFEREEVLEKLLTYFESKVLEDGYKCEVFPMTLVFTSFQIKKS